MSVPGHTAQSNPKDLETTAELPVLDVGEYEAKIARDELSHTDTWSALPAPLSVAPAPPADETARAQHAQLEENLKSLSASLQEFEERLAQKGESLSAM